MSIPTSAGGLSAGEERHMRRALALAERGRGRVSPNPLVGCVLVKAGAVVGEGWHRRAGGPHAEAEALAAAGPQAAGATAYVTLEPCNHFGRTPPCTEALIEAGVGRVVVAALDPDPRVDGGGVRRLREAGLEVVTGVLQEEAERQNRAFRTAQLLGRPFVLYKTAMSLDGKVALRGGPARWITGPEARRLVHEWRDEYDAIGVGVGTVLADDPSLTTRLNDDPSLTTRLDGGRPDGDWPDGGRRAGGPHASGRTPTKVVFDAQARTPPGARLFAPGPDGAPARVLIVAAERAPAARVRALRAAGAEVLLLAGANGRPAVRAALERLKERGITSLLLEGGGTLAWAFFEARAVDEVAWFVAPKLLGGAGAPGPLAGPGVERIEAAVTLAETRTHEVGADLLITGAVRYPEATPDRNDGPDPRRSPN